MKMGMKAYDTTEIKSNLESHEWESFHVWCFARHLSKRLAPEVTALGWLMAIELLSKDLDKGVDGFTGQRIEDKSITHLGSSTYRLLAIFIRMNASILPPEMLAEVKDEWSAVMEMTA
jgi:hypothetical protein